MSLSGFCVVEHIGGANFGNAGNVRRWEPAAGSRWPGAGPWQYLAPAPPLSFVATMGMKKL